MTELKMDYTLKLEKKFKHAKVEVVENSNVIIVSATGSYIPIEEFKMIFNFIGDLVKKDRYTKLVFDKRELDVFHQPSMEWYFVEWKEQMWTLGLKTHRKILPDNVVFQQSVKIGREQIAEKYPNGKFKQMDIKYCNSIEEAIEN